MRLIDDALRALTSAPDLQDQEAVLRHCDSLANELDEADISTEEQVTLIAVLSASHTFEMRSDIKDIQDGYEAVTKELLEVKNSVSKLGDLVRAITKQMPPSSEVAKLMQYLPVSTSDGQTLDLGVQKGMSLKLSKDIRMPSPSSSSIALSSPKTETVSRTAEKEPSHESDTKGEDKHIHSASIPKDISKTESSNEKQQQDPNDQKPLPPVPVAHNFPALPVSNKGVQIHKEPPSVFRQPSATPGKENVQKLPTEEFVKGAAPAKIKKWKEPPLFEQAETETSTSKPRTLFSYNDPVSFEGNTLGTSHVSAPAAEAISMKAVPSNESASHHALKESKQMQNVNKILGENKAPQISSMPYTQLVADTMKSVASELGGRRSHLTAAAPKSTSIHSATSAPQAPSSLLAWSSDTTSRNASPAHTGTSEIPQTAGRLAAKRSGVKVVALTGEGSLKTAVTNATTSASATVPATPGIQIIKSPPFPATPVHSTPKIKQEPVSPVPSSMTSQPAGLSTAAHTQPLPVANTMPFQVPTDSYPTPPTPASAMKPMSLQPSNGSWNPPPTANTIMPQSLGTSWDVSSAPLSMSGTVFSQPSTGPQAVPRTPAPLFQATPASMSGSAPEFRPSTTSAAPAPTQVTSGVSASLINMMSPDQRKLFTSKLNKA